MWQRASFGGAACGAWMAQQWSRHSSHHAAMAEAAAAASSDGRILLHSAGWDAESRVDDKGKRGWWLSSAWCLIPHPDKVAKGGEDAAFGLEHAVGVADGVGGWASKGVDPGIYSKRLMVECHEAVARGEAAAAALPSPAALLRSAYDVVESEHILGSTTACVATLAPCEKGEDGWLLRSANLGDSGLMSSEQQHSFNFPFQLGTNSTDYPEHADQTDVAVRPGDLVVLATDGVWDNLFDEEMLALIQAWVNGGGNSLGRKGLVWLARGVAVASHNFAADHERSSPFSVHSSGRFQGGKMDDITVMISIVRDRPVLSDDVKIRSKL